MKLIRMVVMVTVLAPAVLAGGLSSDVKCAPGEPCVFYSTAEAFDIAPDDDHSASFTRARLQAWANSDAGCNSSRCSEACGGSGWSAENTNRRPYDIFPGPWLEVDHTQEGHVTTWYKATSDCVCTPSCEEDGTCPASVSGRVELTAVQKVLKFLGLFPPATKRPGVK
jgi:hypothetical protein